MASDLTDEVVNILSEIKVGEKLSLVKLNWIFDFQMRTIASLDEINSALRSLSHISIDRSEKHPSFCNDNLSDKQTKESDLITNEEVDNAYKAYRDEFKKAYKKLK